MLPYLVYMVAVPLNPTRQQLVGESIYAGVLSVSKTVAVLCITMQCLVVEFSVTIAPLASITPTHSKVTRLTILVVVYTLQEVF